MSSMYGNGYDLCTSQFSPDGRVFQVEYAHKAVGYSGTAVALRGKDGVVFAVQKFVTSKLYECGTTERIFSIDKHIGMAVAGFIADARHIVEIARSEALYYRLESEEPIPVRVLNERIAMYMHVHTTSVFSRPFGASILMASYEKDGGPQLFCIDPSGASQAYYGCAIGKTKQEAEAEMEDLKPRSLSCKELVKEAAKIIYLAHDEADDRNFEIEMSWVATFTKGEHKIVPKLVLEEAEQHAKDALLCETDSDDEEMHMINN